MCLGTLKKLKTFDGKEVMDVRVSASLKSVTLSFSTIVSPLFSFTSKGVVWD